MSATNQDEILLNNNTSSHDADLINKLLQLPPIGYDRVRHLFAKEMGIRPSTLDAIIKNEKQVGQKDNQSPFEDIDPWPEPVNPDALLTDLSHTIKRFIVCQHETIIAATLWVTMTWFIDVIPVAPLAIITAPEKRCGKSQLLHLFSKLVKKPIVASNITPAALFRSIDLWKPTLLIDEADTFLKHNEELRGLINCGHTRDSAYIIRVVGEELTPKSFCAWGAKALAGIGKLPDTIMDRAIVLPLRRKLPEEHADKMRYATPDLFSTLSAKLARFADDYAKQILANKPTLPVELNDRAQDNWESLLAIAQAAGSEWLNAASQAAVKLSSNIDVTQSSTVELLHDIHDIIEGMMSDRISTVDLISALCNDPEKRWATHDNGRPITPRQLANILKQFGIYSNTVRFGIHTAKGYLFLNFADAFARYIPSTVEESVTASQTCNDIVSGVT